MKRVIVVIIIVAVVVIGIWRTGQAIRSRKQASQRAEKPPVAVEVSVLKRGTIQEELSFVGNIVANSEVTVFPRVAGRIEQILVDEDSVVKKGEAIAKIEDKEASLRVKQAEAALEAARAGLNQSRALSEIRVRSQITQAQANLVSAEAALKQVRDIARTKVSSQLDQAEAGVAALKANLKKIKDGARSEERKQIEATVQQAKANMDNAQADLDRIEKLYSEGAVSTQTLDGARTRATVAKAQYEAASQQMKLVETGARAEDIAAMESQVKQAEAGLELIRSMADSKSWEQDIEMAQARYEQAKAALDAAKALEKAKSWEAEIIASETGVKQAETALELAEETLSNTTVTAPINGVVSKRFLDKGSMANPAAPLFTIVDMDKVKAVVDITEANLSKISLNSRAFISVEEFPEQIAGQITLISPTVKPVSRTVPVEITIDNPSHRLKPGMFVRVTTPVKVRENAILVRRSAVMEDKMSGTSGSKYLFVVDNNTGIKRKVETGISRGDIVEILSGVQPGEMVVVSGQDYIKDGERVQVVKTVE